MRDLLFRCLMRLLVTMIAGSAISTTVLNTNAMNDSSSAQPSNAITTGGQVNSTLAQNPLLAKWEGSYGGVPPFDRVQIALFKPALEAAMAEQLAEIDRIAADSAAPTFANTIEALERAGNSLSRVGALYTVWSSTMNGPEFQVVEREMAPKLAAFNDKITQKGALFKSKA